MFENEDYHIHTCYSDGDLSPEEIVDRYIENGYRRIAITDHDGLEGSLIAVWYSSMKRITVVPGIELSTTDEHGNTVHILGYYINYSNAKLNKTLSYLRHMKAIRNDKLLQVLNEMGYDITIDELLSVNEGRYIGKPTFAKLLVDRGVADSIDDVFKGLFTDKEIRSLKKKTIDTKEAIDIIHDAGGVAVLAHPMEIKRSRENIDTFAIRITSIIDELNAAGLDGIECYHPSADDGDSEFLVKLATERGLCITKGSDFHSEDWRNYEG